MIDSLYKYLPRAVEQQPWRAFNVLPGSYALLTLHRPSNVDDSENLSTLVDIINGMGDSLPVIFPVHPRTRKQLDYYKKPLSEKIILCVPLPYISFLGCMAKACFVVTDSGGIQEETTVLEIPCLTMRSNTERPSTVIDGTNRLVGNDREKILAALEEILTGHFKKGIIPPLWDGKAAQRVVDIIESRIYHR
jgi:UDP-N-acetylglucosamine 2-epimerase (non-hydrolysing)